MQTYIFRSFLFALCLTCLSCQHTHPVQTPSLRLNIAHEPLSLDPRKARDLTDLNIAHMLFEGLTRLSSSGHIELALAERYEVFQEGTQYVFHLRPSVWSDGSPVTAYDFIRSWNEMLHPQFPSSTAYQLYVISGAQDIKAQHGKEWGAVALDASTLSIQLTQPIPYFLELLSMPCFFPTHPLQETDRLITNGPFLLSEWAHGDHLHLVKNPHYWDASLVRLTDIELLMVAPETEQALFAANTLDWAGSPLSSLPLDALNTLKQSPAFHTHPALGTYFFRVNTAAFDQPLLADPTLRHWLSQGIDRAMLVHSVLQGGQTPALTLLPPSMTHYPESIEPISMTPPLPSQLHAPLVLTYANSEMHRLVAQTLQDQWARTLQLHVTLEAVEPRSLYQKLAEGRYHLALGSWFADFQDPINFLEVFKYKEASTNHTGWENQQYIDLLTRSLVCMEIRETLLRQAEEILLMDMPIIPLYHGSFSYLQNPSLHGVVFSALGQIDFRWAYFE